MERIEYLTKSMSRKQKVAYAQICELKQIRAVGQMKKTCKILIQFGLIKQCPDSENKNDYVLDGEPLNIPINEKLPLKKELVQEIKEKRPWDIINETIEERAKPKFRHAAPDHTNLSREDHVRKWLHMPGVEIGKKIIVKVKCLTDLQMDYIMFNYKQQTAQAMAEKLKAEKYRVILFCQANDIDPLQAKKRRPKDDYHCIPPERIQRMKRADYNGPQKKTA
jgi:hypothetical protein